MLSLIIPASNEADYIGPCLAAVFASEAVAGGVEVIVVSNGSRDRTAEVARAMTPPEGWALQVLELEEGSKPAALNAGDRAAKGAMRAYLDADCRLSPPVLRQIVAALSVDRPLYAGATPDIPKPESAVTRAYARFWQALPFNRMVAPGYGLYAVNAAGRAQWGAFPAIISDDTFVRLQFSPEARVQVAGRYDWPMVEGWQALVKVRRRQDAGVQELDALYPELRAREGKPALSKGEILSLALRDPWGFAVYAAVSLSVRLKRGGSGFTRGR